MSSKIQKRRLATFFALSITVVVIWKLHISLQEIDGVEGDLAVKRKQFFSIVKNRTGLKVEKAEFRLDGTPFQIIGGSLHYFRFPEEYWYDRLYALKACGLNTVTTYIPWNAHEPSPGTFDFSGMLDLPKFLEIVQQIGLNVILRVGPYICAEWEWGGLPSWLLRQDGIRVRSSDPTYMAHVKSYFNALLPKIVPYQYIYGGPVIAVQVENEFATYSSDTRHVIALRDMIKESGIKEFMFVCDDRHGTEKNLNYDGMLKTINFQNQAADAFQLLTKTQPDNPLFVSEYWTGWFNTWGGENNNKGTPWTKSLTAEKFESNTAEALDIGKNVNFYVFAGGTNFGFMNGGFKNEDVISPDTTSYDYDALISEEGKLTKKYHITRRLLQSRKPHETFPNIPTERQLASYASVVPDAYLSIFELMKGFKSWMIESQFPISFENFPAVSDRLAAQSYGYAVYECDLNVQDGLNFDMKQSVHDRALLFVNREYQGTLLSTTKEHTLKIQPSPSVTVSFLVENQGRVNWVSTGDDYIFKDQRKGIVGNITVNGKIVSGWRTWPFDFSDQFLSKLSGYIKDNTLKWKKYKPSDHIKGPALLKSELTITESEPKDTFMQLEDFEKGFVVVNGRNVGRYWNSAGPQRRLFVPGVWLHRGRNEIIVFEELRVGSVVSFHKTSGISS